MCGSSVISECILSWVMVKVTVMVKVRLTKDSTDIYPVKKSPTLAHQRTTHHSVWCRSCQIWLLVPSTLEDHLRLYGHLVLLNLSLKLYPVLHEGCDVLSAKQQDSKSEISMFIRTVEVALITV